MSNTIQVKRGANASLPMLNAGEFAFSTDTYQVYIGDGADNHELTLVSKLTTTSGDLQSDIDTKANSGVNADITSMTGLEDDGIPGAKVVAASVTLEGVSKRSTDAEAIIGTNISDHITPANLKYVLDKLDFYGVSWDESQATGGYTRTGRLVGVATGQTLADALIPIQAAMRRCIIDDDGVVQYYLDPSDSTKKVGGGTADLTGVDGQVMVEIPAFYYRYSYSGTTHTWEISLHPLSGFSLHPAFIKNGSFVPYRYIGAYEGILYDTSASRYTNGVYLASHTVSFASSTKTISTGDYNHPYTRFEVGDKIIVANSTSNNGTFTVASTGDQSFTVSESLTDESNTDGVSIQTQKDWTATTGDKLSSVLGKAPINYGTRANFRAAAKNRGIGWRQQDYDLVSAIQLLYLVEYASWNSQFMIGAGLTNFGSTNWSNRSDYNPIETTGLSNSLGNISGGVDNGANSLGSYMSYRGIENFFGHLWKWVDGINIGGSSSADDNKIHVCNKDTDFADNTWTNYTDLKVVLAQSNGYSVTLEQIARGFLPASIGGSSSTYITDYYYQNTGWRVAILGGYAGNGASAGVTYWYLNISSGSAYRNVAGRLSC